MTLLNKIQNEFKKLGIEGVGYSGLGENYFSLESTVLRSNGSVSDINRYYDIIDQVVDAIDEVCHFEAYNSCEVYISLK
jgi:hypothetical protein